MADFLLVLTQDAAQGARETRRSAEELSRMAAELQTIVGRFKG